MADKFGVPKEKVDSVQIASESGFDVQNPVDANHESLPHETHESLPRESALSTSPFSEPALHESPIGTEVIRDEVLAIVVYHDEPLEFLESTLRALALQNYKPREILVTVSHQDLCETVPDEIPPLLNEINLLCQSIQNESGIVCTLIKAPGAQNFGQSVRIAFSQLPACQGKTAALQDEAENQSHQRSDTQATEFSIHEVDQQSTWYWLLHADSAPLPDALDLMLKAGEASRLIGTIGPKQVFWQPHLDGSYDLLEVGINATRSARRVPEIILGERDQGQLDRREDLLAVGSAGMLVRANVYHAVGGFNPILGPFGDGLEFSRRVHSAGYRVVVCPAARIRHAQLSMRPELTHLQGQTQIPQGLRQTHSAEISEKSSAKSYASRRAAQIINALLAVSTLLFPFAVVGYPIAALFRFVIRLIWRDFRRAGGELQAVVTAFRHFSEILAGRSAISTVSSKQNQVSLHNLESSFADIQRAKKSRREAAHEARKMALLPDPLTLQARQDLARHQRNGLLYSTLTALLLSLAFFISYFSAGALAGGQLAADTTTGTQLWQAAKNSWMLSGDGMPNQLDPLWLLYLPILLLAQPLGLTLGLAATITLYLAPIVGAAGAYLFAGQFTRSWIIRYGTSILWILAPAFIEALHDGRIGPALIHVLLPLFGWTFARALGSKPLRSKPGALGFAALILAILSTGAPILLPIGICAAMLSFIFTRSWSWLWLPIPSAVLLLPQLIQIVQNNPNALLTYLFANPGVPIATTTAPNEVLRGFTEIPFTVRHWSFIGFVALGALLLIAVLALLRSTAASRQVRIGWLIGICGIASAVGVLYLPAPEISSFGEISANTPWHGTFFSIAWLGLFIVITAGAHGLRTSLGARSFGVAQLIGVFAIVIFPLSLAALTATSLQLQLDPDTRVLSSANTAPLPAIAADNIQSTSRSRVLALEAAPATNTVNGTNTNSVPRYTAQLWRGAGLQLHEYTLINNVKLKQEVLADAANADLAQTVANLLVAAPDATAHLQQHGVSVVLLPPATPALERTDTRDSEVSPTLDFALHKARNNLAAALQAVPGLEYVTENETGMFWRVIPENGLDISARAWIADESGKLSAIPSGKYQISTDINFAALTETGKIELAERASTGWHAKIDGIELTPTESSSGWAQAWNLSSAGFSSTDLSRAAERTGSVVLQIWHENPLYRGLFVLQLLIGVISVVAALPLRVRKTGVI